jgi:hypothetical protein
MAQRKATPASIFRLIWILFFHNVVIRVRNRTARFRCVCDSIEGPLNIRYKLRIPFLVLIIRIKVKLSLCFFCSAPRHGCLLNWGYVAPLVLWPLRWVGWVVGFAPRPLCLRGGSPWFRWGVGWGGPGGRSGRDGGEGVSRPPPKIGAWSTDLPARGPTLYLLNYHGSYSP